jgi:hypothetical protein
MSHSIKSVGSKANGSGKSPGTIDASALDDGPRMAGAVPFPDLEAALGLDDEGVNVTELLLTVVCRKPRATEFFRVHPSETMAKTTWVFTDKEEIGADTYFVMPAARPFITEHLRPVLLVTCVNRQNIPFLWPIAVPAPDSNSGRQNRWGASALEAMEIAKRSWTKLTAGPGFYRVFRAEKSDLPEPVWPDKSFVELLGVAFRETLIADQEHPIVRRLRGQV